MAIFPFSILTFQSKSFKWFQFYIAFVIFWSVSVIFLKTETEYLCLRIAHIGQCCQGGFDSKFIFNIQFIFVYFCAVFLSCFYFKSNWMFLFRSVSNHKVVISNVFPSFGKQHHLYHNIMHCHSLRKQEIWTQTPPTSLTLTVDLDMAWTSSAGNVTLTWSITSCSERFCGNMLPTGKSTVGKQAFQAIVRSFKR